MLRKLAKMALAATSLLFYSTGAIAYVPKGPIVKSAILDLTSKGEITVIAPDGENYSELVPSNLTFSGYAGASMKRGKVTGYGVYSGVCGPGLCGTPAFKRLHFSDVPTRDDFGDEGMSFTFSTDNFPQGLSNNIQAANIFQACNNRTSGGQGQADQTFTHNVKVTLGLNTKQKFDTSTVDYADDFSVPVTVRCQATSKIEAPPQPYSVELKVTPQGATCPKKTEVRAFIRYNVPATAKFRFKLDGKLSELHTIKARKVGGGKPGQHSPGGRGTYLVERVKYYYLDPGKHKFRIEVRGGKRSNIKTLTIKCPPFKVFSSWLKYKVQNTPVCPKNVKEVATFKATRPGSAPYQIKTQGGMVVRSGTATFKRKGREYVAKVRRKNLKMGAFDSDMMAEITNQPSANSGWVRLKIECLKLAGDFSFLDGSSTRCPREGKALINFSMNMKAKIEYSLDCTNGSFSGTVQAVPDNKGGFVAPALVKFNINKTKQVTCALKTVTPVKQAHALKTRLFRCVKLDIPSGSNDLGSSPRPPTSSTDPAKFVIDPPRPPRPPENTVPGIIVDPVRTISCERGIVRNRSCFCPRTRKKVSVGPNAWRCDKRIVIDPPRPPNGPSSVPGGPSTVPGYTIVAPAKTDNSAADARREAAKKAAEAKRKREAAMKAAKAAKAAAKRKAAKKAAEAAARRKAAKKAAEAAKKAAKAAKKAAKAAKKAAKAAKKAARRRAQ